MTAKVQWSFHLDEMDAFRNERVASINTLMRRLDAPRFKELSPNAEGYAVAHHFLEGAEKAAQFNDLSSLRWYCAKTEADLSYLRVARSGVKTLAVAASRADLQTSTSIGAAYCFIDPRSNAVDDATQTLLLSAFEYAGDAGFSELLGGHATVVCVVDDPEMQSPRNWTVSRLPGTVFVLKTSPVLMAEDIVHESGHSWLTDALLTYNISVKSDRLYFSPWKREKRPMFGFLHACWAFPLTVIFLASVIDRVSRDEVLSLERYIEEQRQFIRAVRSDFYSVVESLSNDVVGSRLVNVYETASSI